MIRIRKKDKSTITLPNDAMFVELVDDYGEILQVICEDKNAHSFTYFGFPDEKALKYEQVFNVRFVKKNYDVDLHQDITKDFNIKK